MSKASNIIVKDFMGRLLSDGDNVVISDCTYSKTPYLVYGKIRKIGDPVYFNNGSFNYVRIDIEIFGESDIYREALENTNYDNPAKGMETVFIYSNRSFVSILKVN